MTLLAQDSRHHFVSPGICTLLTVLVLNFFTILSSRSKAVKCDDTFHFGPPLALKLLLSALGVGFAGMTVYFALQAPFNYLSLTFLIFALLGAFGLPPEITVSSSGVTQKYWWTTTKSIRWEDVKRIEPEDKTGTTRVVSSTGVTISHSKLNRDGFGFYVLCSNLRRNHQNAERARGMKAKRAAARERSLGPKGRKNLPRGSSAKRDDRH